MGLFSKKKSIVGVDIGTSYIKLVQIDHAKDKKTLQTYGIVNLSSQITGASGSQGIRDTATILANLLAKARVSTKTCVASLPNSAVFTSVIEMPVMTDSELAQALQFEAKKYVPLPFSEVSLQSAILSREDHTIKVLLVAVPKTVMANYQQVFSLAGLDLQVLDVEAMALSRALIIDTTKNSVIIDIGAKVTGLNVLKGGLLQLTRNLNVGGDTITDNLAKSLNITPGRAEQFKKDFGLGQSDFLPEAVKPVLANIKSEVKQILSIYQSHDLHLDNIILVGGGAQLPGISGAFGDLGLPVTLGNPLAAVSYPQSGAALLKRFSLQLPIAIGLALRD